MENLKIKLKLDKYCLKLLTFWLSYAMLTLEYTGIAVYFAGQKSYTPQGKEAQQNKKQNRGSAKVGRYASTPLHAGHLVAGGGSNYAPKAVTTSTHPLLGIVTTFCFLWKRLFVSQRSSLYKNKYKYNKTEHYDSRLLSTPRHLAGDRPQQNNRHPLGRGRSHSQSTPRQSRLALLHASTGRRNYSVGSRHRLLPQWARGLQKSTHDSHFALSRSVRLLGVFNCATYVWSYYQQQKYFSLTALTNILIKIQMTKLKSQMKFKIQKVNDFLTLIFGIHLKFGF